MGRPRAYSRGCPKTDRSVTKMGFSIWAVGYMSNGVEELLPYSAGGKRELLSLSLKACRWNGMRRNDMTIFRETDGGIAATCPGTLATAACGRSCSHR